MVASILLGLVNLVTIYAMEGSDSQDKNPATVQGDVQVPLVKSSAMLKDAFEISNSFLDHIELVKYYNSETLGGFDQEENSSYSPELSQKCLDRVLSLLNQRNDYYVEAVAYLQTTLTFTFSSSPFTPKEGALNYTQAILKRLAEIGTPYDKFIYAEKGVERSRASFCSSANSNFTEEEVELWKKMSALQTGEEREKFYTNVIAPYKDKKAVEAAEKDIQDNFSPPLLYNERKLFFQIIDFQGSYQSLFDIQQKVIDFIKRGILENAMVIGANSVPRVKKLSEIEIAIQPVVLESLGVLCTAAQENGKDDYIKFWLEVKRLLEQKVIRFLRTNKFERNNAFLNDERNLWYEQAVAQIIEEKDPEALNYYRVLKLEHGYINLYPPFTPQKVYLSLPREGRYKAPYMSQLKKYLSIVGFMPYYERVQHDIITKATSLSEKQIQIIQSASQKETGKFVSIGSGCDTSEAFVRSGYYGCNDALTISKARVDLSGSFVVEEPLFIKARLFYGTGIIDAPKGAVIVAEELHLGALKVSNRQNVHFIQVPKVKLDDTLTICDEK